MSGQGSGCSAPGSTASSSVIALPPSPTCDTSLSSLTPPSGSKSLSGAGQCSMASSPSSVDPQVPPVQSYTPPSSLKPPSCSKASNASCVDLQVPLVQSYSSLPNGSSRSVSTSSLVVTSLSLSVISPPQYSPHPLLSRVLLKTLPQRLYLKLSSRLFSVALSLDPETDKWAPWMPSISLESQCVILDLGYRMRKKSEFGGDTVVTVELAAYIRRLLQNFPLYIRQLIEEILLQNTFFHHLLRCCGEHDDIDFTKGVADILETMIGIWGRQVPAEVFREWVESVFEVPVRVLVQEAEQFLFDLNLDSTGNIIGKHGREEEAEEDSPVSPTKRRRRSSIDDPEDDQDVSLDYT
ncbi:hypothetical protein R3P38DRAFT_3289039 [Favolaschia claudopus]|uniref:Uncharacterized protein n=1 Tax=Favolaschia claudopus TaxID=2862362 RepID=A0AAV9ZWG3_9AGAR